MRHVRGIGNRRDTRWESTYLKTMAKCISKPDRKVGRCVEQEREMGSRQGLHQTVGGGGHEWKPMQLYICIDIIYL